MPADPASGAGETGGPPQEHGNETGDSQELDRVARVEVAEGGEHGGGPFRWDFLARQIRMRVPEIAAHLGLRGECVGHDGSLALVVQFLALG